MDGVVVHHYVKLAFGVGARDLPEECQELLAAVTRFAGGGDLAAGLLQGREQGRGAVAHVVGRATLDQMRLRGQHRSGAVCGLDLALLVNRQHDVGLMTAAFYKGVYRRAPVKGARSTPWAAPHGGSRTAKGVLAARGACAPRNRGELRSPRFMAESDWRSARVCAQAEHQCCHASSALVDAGTGSAGHMNRPSAKAARYGMTTAARS